MGLASGGVSSAVAQATQACGVFAGALVGSVTGAGTGAWSSYMMNGFNNLVAGNSFNQGWRSAAASGALSGALSGAVSGGIRGYNYAKEQGINPWNRNIESPLDDSRLSEYKPEVYESTSLKTPVLQPDNSKYCYAYAAEYADQGHYNHSAQDFIMATIDKNGNVSDGYNPIEAYNKVNNTSFKLSRFRNKDVLSLGFHLRNNTEVISVTNNHAFNVRSITVGYRVHMFGGKVGNTLRLFSAGVHDPLVGYTTKHYLQTISLMRF